ncbi:MAG TPA: transporter substrate-binding domain-containing protein [Gammaproteobacteria bacterium]|nr:transporter substrate-binding domain-containing protein [Gammaproteobacteria bacterium]
MTPAPLSDFRLWRSISTAALLLAILVPRASYGDHASVDLTTAQKQWLANLPAPIRRGADPAWPPFEFLDRQGIYAGMCQDYTNIIVERLHLQLELVPNLDWNEVLDGIRKHDLDVISCISMTPDRETYLAFTKPFITSPQVIFTREDYPYVSGLRALDGKSVAAVKGYSITDILVRDYPGLKLVMMENTLAALHAVAVGQADAFVDTLAVGIYYIRKLNLANLKVAAPARVPPLEMRFGFRKDWWPIVPIVEKALDTITAEEHTAIQQHWVNVKYDPMIDYSLLWKVGGTLSVLLFLAILWIRQVQQQKQVVQASEKRLTIQRDTLKRLTEDLEAYGDRVARELKMARETQTVLLPDMATVQSVLDTHGIHVDSRFQPSSELGGDFWGLRTLDPMHAAILMVDFSGHGINAALNTFRLHALLDSEKEFGGDPASFLEHLNRRLAPLLPPGQYATMFYGVMDLSRDLLTYAGAATPRPFLFLPGEEQPLTGDGKGYPLGMFEESTYENRELPFPKGSSLLLYSDAITECKTRDGTRLEEQGLVAVAVRCLKSAPREELVKSIAGELNRIFNMPLTDDLTIVCATRSQQSGQPADPEGSV